MADPRVLEFLGHRSWGVRTHLKQNLPCEFLGGL